MSFKTALKLYEVRTSLTKADEGGSGSDEFYVHSGSRMLVSFLIRSIDPGTTVRVFVDNGFDQDEPYDTIETIDGTTAGLIKRVYSDFNNLFKIRYEIVGGGVATFKVAVALFDNAGTTKIEGAQLAVDLSANADGTGRFDSVRIGDGTNLLHINPDGSITVDNAADEATVTPYDEVASIPSGIETAVVSYTVPLGKVAFLYRAEGSGENIGQFKIYKNDDAIASRRTHYAGGLNADFDFTSTNKRSVQLDAGDVLKMKVLHSRPLSGNFEGRFVLLEKDA